MKTILYLLAVILIVVGAVYLLVPASALPAFFPGYDPGMTRVRFNHGVASVVVGIVVFLIAWFVGRKA